MSSWKAAVHAACAGARRVAVLGVGSELCGDDAAGMLLIHELRRRLPPDGPWLLLAGSTAPENFTGAIRSFAPDLLIMIDAAQLGLAMGEIGEISPDQVDEAGFSTHMLPLRLTLSYVREEVGCQILLLGIQPGAMEFATPPSAAVVKAAAELSDYLVSEMLFLCKNKK